MKKEYIKPEITTSYISFVSILGSSKDVDIEDKNPVTGTTVETEDGDGDIEGGITTTP